MANNSHLFGLRPSRLFDSSPYNGQASLFYHSSSDTSAIYKGDLVQFDATNRGSPLADPYAPLIPAVKAVTAAQTTTTFRGVVVGFVAQPEFSQLATASLGTTYILASTTRYLWVVEDYSVIFEGEESGNSYVSNSNNATNKNIDIAYTAGNTTTGISQTALDATTLSTSAVKPFRVLRYTQKPDNFGFTASDSNSRAHLDVLIINTDQNQGGNGA